MLIRTLAASALVATAAGTASAQAERPFKGEQSSEYQIVNVHGPSNELVDAVATGTGNFTHMGLATYEIQLTLNTITGVGAGSSTYVAADGSQIFHVFTIQALSATDRYYEVTAVGGTGRFENVSGFYIGFGTIAPTSPLAGTEVSSYDGWISY